MKRSLEMVYCGLVCLVCAAAQGADDPDWLDDYGAAMSVAKQNNRKMLVYFHEEGVEVRNDALCRKLAGDEELRPAVGQHVLVRLPLSHRSRVRGEQIQLIRHRVFAELQGKPGVAVIDFEDPDSESFGHVVSLYPLGLSDALTTRNLAVLLSLPVTSQQGEDLRWLDEYREAMRVAEQNNQMLLVYFHKEGVDIGKDALCAKLAVDQKLYPAAGKHVMVRLPVSYRSPVQGEEIQLIRHPVFAELRGEPGIAVIDFEDPDGKYFGHVVSVYPLSLPAALSTKHLLALLSLPSGSLTQRTLILAVRIHPEGPESTNGTMLTTLAKESESHSTHQARITNQGHHNWDSRFHRISGRLPDGLLATEVCAESWPGKGLIAAAIDVVHSWRQSSGHWNAVRGRHRYYGYDMKRGRNGIWYATGIFSSR